MTASIAAQRLVSGFRAFQMMVAACKLKLPDLVADGPKTLDHLAAATGVQGHTLRRLLRGLEVWGVLIETPDERFASTELSDQFRSDKPGLRNLTIMLSEEGYEAWSDLMYTLSTGKPAYEHLYGKSHFERIGENPEMSAHFNAAMVESSIHVARAFSAAYDFTGVRSVVDVGGGNGAVLIAILQANPGMQGVLFDLEQGLAGANEKLVAAGVAERVTLQEGSFFEAVTAGSDLYLLKWIVHDWDDERALAILKNCKLAMHAKARLVLLERKLPERIEDADEALAAVMGDLQMMVVLGGKERTTNEYRDLLAQAGLRMTREIPIEPGFAAIEALAAD